MHSAPLRASTALHAGPLDGFEVILPARTRSIELQRGREVHVYELRHDRFEFVCSRPFELTNPSERKRRRGRARS